MPVDLLDANALPRMGQSRQLTVQAICRCMQLESRSGMRDMREGRTEATYQAARLERQSAEGRLTSLTPGTGSTVRAAWFPT